MFALFAEQVEELPAEPLLPALASDFAGWQVSEAVCYAIVIRFRQDEATTMPQDGLVRERWEIPLFRLVFRKAVGRS